MSQANNPRPPEHQAGDLKEILLPAPIVLGLKARDAWRDRRDRRNYEGPQDRAKRLGPWTCSMCWSEAQGHTCSACGTPR